MNTTINKNILEFRYSGDLKECQAHNKRLHEWQNKAVKAIWAVGLKSGNLAETELKWDQYEGLSSYVVTGTPFEISSTHACVTFYADPMDWNPSGLFAEEFAAEYSLCLGYGWEEHGSSYKLDVKVLSKEDGIKFFKELHDDFRSYRGFGGISGTFYDFIIRLTEKHYPHLQMHDDLINWLIKHKLN